MGRRQVILLDTNVLIAPPSSWPDDSFGSSILSLAELHFGIQAATDRRVKAERTRRVARLRTLLDWIPFDEYSAAAYGVLAAEVSRRRPGHARSKDIMIASQAYSLGIPLMTRNVKDFDLVAHLVEILEVS